MKKSWNIYICILITIGLNEEITIEANETFHAEPNKNSEDLTTLGYEIAQFNDKNTEVRIPHLGIYFKVKKIFNRIL